MSQAITVLKARMAANWILDSGFDDIAVEVCFRYGAADILRVGPAALSELESEVVEELMSRFTSAAITARRLVVAEE